VHATKQSRFYGPWPVLNAQGTPSRYDSDVGNRTRQPNAPLPAAKKLSLF
jgi:hypothetical protein